MKNVLSTDSPSFFRRSTPKKTKEFWRCDKRDFDCCKARLHYRIRTQEIIKQVGEHSHKTDATAINIAKVRSKVKQRAISTMEV